MCDAAQSFALTHQLLGCDGRWSFAGPSFVSDTACSSSLLALHQAVRAMRSGECEAAIVAGTNLCLCPTSSVQLQKLGVLSPDGACKSFDASGSYPSLFPVVNVKSRCQISAHRNGDITAHWSLIRFLVSKRINFHWRLGTIIDKICSNF